MIDIFCVVLPRVLRILRGVDSVDRTSTMFSIRSLLAVMVLSIENIYSHFEKHSLIDHRSSFIPIAERCQQHPKTSRRTPLHHLANCSNSPLTRATWSAWPRCAGIPTNSPTVSSNARLGVKSGVTNLSWGRPPSSSRRFSRFALTSVCSYIQYIVMISQSRSIVNIEMNDSCAEKTVIESN